MSFKRMISVLIALSISVTAHAGDDPSIQGDTRKGIQAATATYIDQAQVGGSFYIYDPVADSVLELKFKEVHAGIAKKGPFFASCADFSAGDTAYDLDFLVAEKNGVFKVFDVVVHKVGDQKRDYLVSK